MKIDNTDKKIINALIDNSRLSCREISRKLRLNVVTVLNRMRKLEKEGILKKYTAEVDYKKIGYDIEVAIDIKISKGRLFEVEKKIASHPNVFLVYDLTGESDALIFARFPSTQEMDNFLKDIQKYDFVERTHTRLILNRLKEGHMKFF
ncbi:Lrp/AsnC family transcriptional regulator [Candidatus Pacearchaeota archaeon]|nr:Lrp/AsnC family transcriptional regulator [Candidatus Pacearchaeota archaeon]